MAERDLELALMRLAWRLDDLDKWRGETVDPWRGAMELQLQGLVKADEIADAVAKKMDDKHTLRLTLVQKTVAGLVGAVAIADGIRGLVS